MPLCISYLTLLASKAETLALYKSCKNTFLTGSIFILLSYKEGDHVRELQLVRSSEKAFMRLYEITIHEEGSSIRTLSASLAGSFSPSRMTNLDAGCMFFFSL
jgi:hypothetical protein